MVLYSIPWDGFTVVLLSWLEITQFNAQFYVVYPSIVGVHIHNNNIMKETVLNK